jgi:hypothetical protein
MKTNQRKILALILIIIGIIAFLFGAWLLYGLLFGGSDSDLNLPEAGQDLNVTSREVVPQTYEAPVVIEGDSNFDETARGADLTEAINMANSVVSRMGSGTSQDGFLGYDDVMVDATPKFQAYLASEQLRMANDHPSTGELYGITTRVVSSKVISGANGTDRIVVLVQTQKAIDAGNRAKPTNVIYEEHQVSLLRQVNGEYLIDFIETKSVE